MDDVISRKAAIALADKLKDNLPDDERIADAVMAHNEGILEYQTALSLLPSVQPNISDTNVGDTIKRQDAIDAAKRILGDYEIARTMQTALYILPPAPTPSRQIGYWMRMSDLDESEDDRYQCSCCGNVVHHRDKVFLYTYNSWCGACGANMNVKNYVAYMQGGAV